MSSPVPTLLATAQPAPAPLHMAKSAQLQQQKQQEQQQEPRRRFHTWTRRYRRLRSDGGGGGDGFQGGRSNVVNGDTHICFAQDNSWFQGNIVSSHNHHYKVMGRRMSSRDDDGAFPQIQSAGGPFDHSHTNLVSSLGSGETTPVTRSNKSSECDSLDSELVNDALLLSNSSESDDSNEDASFDADVSDEEEAELYKVTVVDFETGLDYHVDNVRVVNCGSECRASSDVFRFRSEQAFKGAIANKVLIQQMGPSFADQRLVVFRGEVRFVYQDRQCYPVSVDATQWCL